MSDDAARALIVQAQGLLTQALDQLAPAGGATVLVKNGENLQKAIDAAPWGAVVRVQPGVYDGIVLKGTDRNLTIRPDSAQFDAPVPVRIDPSWLPACIQLRQNVGGVNFPSSVCIGTQQGASKFRVIGVAGIPGTNKDAKMVVLGTDTETDPAKQPGDLVFERCLFVADPAVGMRGGIVANTRSFAVIRSHFDQFWCDRDSQCVVAWNGPGPFLIDDCYLCASGENVMFGGADSGNLAMMPGDVTITGCHVFKRPEWQGVALHTVKNSIEFKVCKSARVSNCLFENCWVSGQVGFMAVLTPRNQNGKAPWSGIQDLAFEWNVWRNCAGFLNVLGSDNLQPSQRTTKVKFRNNLIYACDKKWGTNGKFFQVTGSPSPLDVEVTNNTSDNSFPNSFLSMAASGIESLKMTNNVLSEGNYGLFSDGLSPGLPAWAVAVNSIFDTNLIQKGTSGRNIKYPGTANVLTAAGASAIGPDFKLLPLYAGQPFGADIDGLRTRVKF